MNELRALQSGNKTDRLAGFVSQDEALNAEIEFGELVVRGAG